MKTTIDLPDDLVREVKLRALMQGRTLRDVVADFIRQGLSLPPTAKPDPPPHGSLIEIGADGLPVVQCRTDAPARSMSPQDLIELEQSALAAQDIHDARRPV